MMSINHDPETFVYPADMNEGQEALALWLRRLELRSPLTNFDRETVLSFPGTLRRYASSRDIVRLGERTQQSCLVVDGIVARFGQTSEGHRQLTAFYIPGDMADLHSAVLPVVTAPLQSAMTATVYFVPHDVIRRAGERSATLARAFWRDCVVDAQVASEWLLNVGRRGALARVAHLLCELSCRHFAVGLTRYEFPLNLTQTHIGEALGLTGVHVNRMMRALRSQSLVQTEGNMLKILDWAGLASVGDFDPGYLHMKREVDD
ncbi:Crp/Fnr family transcriptional regulator [Sphingomonas floccifaciens]|uniref:Crp/Fnr family transcriptional regulator n=1 Tax=Sphingomonas floccifaciens TaxID=1844115 RepID=A0ABW4NI04_9SPHN